ncbi:tripartite tricarboxylate transporter TctB family protein [Rhizobiaceae bacterium LC148]|nr:tripartite tricarboxylate transporter TctB family protein [Rhizobiaceae bacterium LC148]
MRFIMTNRFLGLGFVAVGAVILFLSLQLPQPMAATRIAYGPGFFPTILGAVVTIAGLLMAIINPADAFEEDEEHDAFAWRQYIRPAIVAAAALVYILFSTQLGFLILAPIILTMLLVMGRVVLWQAFLIGIAGPVIIYILFAKLLLVPLPLGLLAPIGAYL